MHSRGGFDLPYDQPAITCESPSPHVLNTAPPLRVSYSTPFICDRSIPFRPKVLRFHIHLLDFFHRLFVANGHNHCPRFLHCDGENVSLANIAPSHLRGRLIASYSVVL
ncbi:hypothetical protein BDW22DRAFT_1361220 [Trametopsis cervina]|nr:hypothetical protein BDW22DRAFT_1361220 [Trametopsis cervina]